jgi:hypothetical protein
MRNLNELNKWRSHPLEDAHCRRTGLMKNPDPALMGIFLFTPKVGTLLRCFASATLGWDHVSVSLSNRCPTWAEMEFVKRKFFKDEETAYQLHAPPSDHINVHPYCLHLWRPHDFVFPMPPRDLV